MQPGSNNKSSKLALTSTAFGEGAPIPTLYTCKGQNTSPPLDITGVPNTAKSIALVMHDPDAVSGDFVHWLIWNIPVSTTSIAASSVPTIAVQGQNGRGQNGYTGPCPPAGTGTHHYIFELYALDKTLDLPAGASSAQLEAAMTGHVIAQHTLTGLFAAG